MNNIFADEVDAKRILREIVLLRQLKHPCVVELLDIIEPTDRKTFDEVYIVLEYCEGDLKKLIKSSGMTLELNHIQVLVWNLLHAIKYMHDSQVLHRDIKPANVLTNENLTIKVCDFGLARSIEGIGDLTKVILSGVQLDHEDKTDADQKNDEEVDDAHHEEEQ